MKKPTLYLLLFALLFSLVSCLNTGNGTETTTDSETTTPAESESTTPDESGSDPIPDDPQPNPFSGGTEIESIVAVDQAGTKNEITRKTTVKEIYELFPTIGDSVNGLLSMWSVVALETEEGDMVVLDYANQKLYLYPNKEEITKADMDQIQRNMTILEVVLLLQHPEKTVVMSSISLRYFTTDGILYYEIYVGQSDFPPYGLWVVSDIYTNYLEYSEEPLLPAAALTATEVTAGMTKDALVLLLSDEKHIDLGEHILFRDKEGKSVIVTFDERNTVTDMVAYAPPAQIPTSEDVKALREKGATIFDYVEACGLPYMTQQRKNMLFLYVMTQDGSRRIGRTTDGETFELY